MKKQEREREREACVLLGKEEKRKIKIINYYIFNL